MCLENIIITTLPFTVIGSQPEMGAKYIFQFARDIVHLIKFVNTVFSALIPETIGDTYVLSFS